jgi:LuxR family maltose regulon positive regulatory protein
MPANLTSQYRAAYPLLATRFSPPPLPAASVPRPRLIQRMNQAPQVPLALISAPPGFGKSSLACQWMHHHVVEEQN